MPYLQKFTLVALFTICSVSLSSAMNLSSDSDSDDDPFHPFGEAALSAKNRVIETDNPDKIYEHVLKGKNASQTAWIIDVDGTITNEQDPSKFHKDQIVTQKGNSLQNIKDLIQQGAVVILCSAWVPFKDTLMRLKQIGFTDTELGNTSEAPTEKSITLTTQQYYTVNLKYYQSGHAISTKLKTFGLNDLYFRNKAFSLMLLPLEQIEKVEEIYFIDDNFTNHQDFIKDVNNFELYQNKVIHHYLITSSSEQISSISPNQLD